MMIELCNASLPPIHCHCINLSFAEQQVSTERTGSLHTIYERISRDTQNKQEIKTGTLKEILASDTCNCSKRQKPFHF